MSGYFRIKSKVNLDDAQVGEVIPESDFCTLTQNGAFVQMEYVEEEKAKKSVTIKPGIWAINNSMGTLVLRPTTFTQDKLLDSFFHTKNVTDKIDCFFNRLHVYKEFGIEVAKRTILLFGPAGSGKSSIITKVCTKYSDLPGAAIVLWKTDKYDPYEVKMLFKNAQYEGVEKLILVAEDLGGVEVDQVRIKSESSLLSLLDNQEKALTIPTLILLTTNFPENFLANLMDRPGRIDDKIEVGYPPGEARQDLFKFFARPSQELSEEAMSLIASKPCDQFTPAHIKEIFVRAAIYDLSLLDSIRSLIRDVESYRNAFAKKKSLGIRSTTTVGFDD